MNTVFVWQDSLSYQNNYIALFLLGPSGFDCAGQHRTTALKSVKNNYRLSNYKYVSKSESLRRQQGGDHCLTDYSPWCMRFCETALNHRLIEDWPGFALCANLHSVPVSWLGTWNLIGIGG